jgi:hypothetical protein
MSVTRVFRLYDPKKHSVRAQAVVEKVNDQYVDNALLVKLGLKLGDMIYITYSAEAPNAEK